MKKLVLFLATILGKKTLKAKNILVPKWNIKGTNMSYSTQKVFIKSQKKRSKIMTHTVKYGGKLFKVES